MLKEINFHLKCRNVWLTFCTLLTVQNSEHKNFEVVQADECLMACKKAALYILDAMFIFVTYGLGIAGAYPSENA